MAIAGHGVNGSNASAQSGDRRLLPTGPRRVVVVVLAIIVGGAAYLAIVRGPAILLDLGQMAAGFFCL